MLLDDSESEQLKTWVIKRLEDISDADSDVLADYVLALVKSDEPDEQVKQNCLDNLEDFLHDNTRTFVDDVINAVKTKSFDPTKPAQKPLAPTAPAFNPPTGPAGRRSSLQAPDGSSFEGGQSRKRAYNDWDGAEGQNGQQYGRGSGGDRPMKQMRRGRGGFDQRGGRAAQSSMNQGFQGMGGQQMPQMPTPPPGMPPFDPNNPLAALLAMQAMGLPAIPGMPQLPFAGSPTGFQQQGESQAPRRTGERCRDYDTKGFCALGASCPYEHGNEVIVPNSVEEYDPNNASLEGSNQDQPQNRRHNERGRGRGRGRGDRGAFRGGRGARADFSAAGPNNDRSITSVVVEQIPEDKFDEQSVRDFFSEFGTIEEVNMQAYKRLAIIKFSDYASARRAYDSPKVIFDNRFVKVYWYKPDSLPKPSGYQNGGGERKRAEDDVEMQEEEKIDPVEFAKQQEEKQRAHDEKQKRIKEAEAQREELEKKLKAQAEERNKLMAKLAAKERAKSGTSGAAVPANDVANGDAVKPTSQTEALKAKLAELEKEAESIGLNPNEEPWQGFPTRGRGRGGYRGRGGFQPRGAWRGGRGGFAPRGGAVMRLDNRPKKVAVVFPNGEEMGPEKDEALRQYLLFNDMMESADVSPHPDRKDAALVAFKERYLAENFLAQAQDIPHVGKVELSWVANNVGAPFTTPGTAATAPPTQAENGTKDVKMDDGQDLGRADVDYDVAGDDDAWLMG